MHDSRRGSSHGARVMISTPPVSEAVEIHGKSHVAHLLPHPVRGFHCDAGTRISNWVAGYVVHDPEPARHEPFAQVRRSSASHDMGQHLGWDAGWRSIAEPWAKTRGRRLSMTRTVTWDGTQRGCPCAAPSLQRLRLVPLPVPASTDPWQRTCSCSCRRARPQSCKDGLLQAGAKCWRN